MPLDDFSFQLRFLQFRSRKTPVGTLLPKIVRAVYFLDAKHAVWPPPEQLRKPNASSARAEGSPRGGGRSRGRRFDARPWPWPWRVAVAVAVVVTRSRGRGAWPWPWSRLLVSAVILFEFEWAYYLHRRRE